jgi:hypothetical protein
MPKQDGAIYWLRFAPLVLGSQDCFLPVVSASGWAYYWQEISGTDTCLVKAFSECIPEPIDWFAAYIGFVASSSVFDDSYCAVFGRNDLYYTYLNGNGISCGEQLMVEVERLSIPTLNIYPNPATDLAKLSVQSTASEELTISIMDILGRSMTNIEPQTLSLELDVSNWPNGIYFVVLADKNGTAHTEKLVVRH